MPDIFPDEFVSEVKIPKKVPSYTGHKRKVVHGVFSDFLKIMIDDMIENNTKFRSPDRYGFTIYIREKKGAEKRKIMENPNRYKAVDIIASNAQYYEFVLISENFKKNEGQGKWRKIRIAYKKYHELVDKVNKGKRYHEV